MNQAKKPDLMKPLTLTKETAQDYICARIMGGLGNQMFQYAAALAQSQRLGSKLTMHVASSERLTHANFGLDIFNIDSPFWDGGQDADASLADRLAGRVEKRRKQGRLWLGNRFQHDGLTYNPDIKTAPSGSYLAGYFQSEDYFADHADLIRQCFSLAHFDEALDPESRALVERPGSISVHVRRGDYLYDPKTLRIHGIMEDDYYNAARDLMAQMVPDAHFCVFSDDTDAASELTRNWVNTTIMPEVDRAHDLLLMTKCSHHIVANSSFSWWGAWLNAKEGKTVIAPRRWFTREHMQTTYIDDICPKGWILI